MADMVESDHSGNYREIEHHLTQIIYQMHYLPWETFGGGPVRDNVWILEKLRDRFAQARRIQWQESQSERGRDTEYPWNH